MAQKATRLRLGFLIAACLTVAAPPAAVVWRIVRPAPWDSRTLLVHFESVRFETAALVFTYSVENRAWRSLRLTPDHTEIRLVQQKGQPPAGYPNFLPLYLEGHTSQRVELRMELPARPNALYGQHLSEENTRHVLEQAVPGISADDGPGAPLPRPRSTARDPQPPGDLDMMGLIEDALRSVDGFELIDPGKGVRLVFPRGW